MNRMPFFVALAVWSFGAGAPSADIVVDLRAGGHVFDGFGVQVWPGDARIEKVIGPLGVKWVRVAYGVPGEVPAEAARAEYDAYWAKSDPSGMRATWEILKRHGVNVILCNFAIPAGKWWKGKNLDPAYHEPFARWWGALVGYLCGLGMKPAYVELFNEPDGDWNGRVPAAEYTRVVKLARAELDARGLNDVGIVGPGLAHIDLGDSDPWVEALDNEGLAAWSVHGWEWREGKNDGARYNRDCWAAGFGKSVALRDPGRVRPIVVTEYATQADTFHGQKLASPSDSTPYAVRVFENTLSFLNCGANAVIYWQALDMDWDPKCTLGLIAVDGRERPVFHALRTLVPELPIGARVLRIAKQDPDVYAAAFLSGGRLVLALANGSAGEQVKTLSIINAAGVKVIKGASFANGAIQNRALEATKMSPDSFAVRATLPPDSTLTVVCNVETPQTG